MKRVALLILLVACSSVSAQDQPKNILAGADIFKRYTEAARRVIFFARYEVSQSGGMAIESEHLLLGLVREGGPVLTRFVRDATITDLRNEITSHMNPKEKVDASVDLPLSNECRRILAYTAEEAERLNSGYIGTEHLLL